MIACFGALVVVIWSGFRINWLIREMSRYLHDFLCGNSYYVRSEIICDLFLGFL